LAENIFLKNVIFLLTLQDIFSKITLQANFKKKGGKDVKFYKVPNQVD